MIEALTMTPEEKAEARRARKRKRDAARVFTPDQIARKRAGNAKRYAANPGPARARSAAYNAANREKKAARDAKYHAENRERILAEQLLRRTKRRKEELVRKAASRAKKVGMEHTITAGDLKWPSECPVLGIPLNYEGGKGVAGRDNSPSLDRWRNDVGYTKHNTVVISYRANRLKNDGSLDELRRVVWYSQYGRFLPPPGCEDFW